MKIASLKVTNLGKLSL